MYEINIPAASQILFTIVVTAVITGIIVFIFQKVFVERPLSRSLERLRADLQRTIQNEARQVRFTERQVEEFYSPILGCLKKIQAKSLLRIEIDRASEVAWQEICTKHPQPFWDHEKYFEPFMKSIRYNNEELRKDILPLYDEMVTIFTEKYWLANPSTQQWFSELSAFVSLWRRWLDESIPPEVVNEIGHNEDQLKPFYEDLHAQITALTRRLSGG
jgi:hypothetical protein